MSPRPALHAPCGVGLHAKAIDEDVDQPQDALLPTGLVVDVAHADEGPQKVFRADITAHLARRHGAIQQGADGLRVQTNIDKPTTLVSRRDDAPESVKGRPRRHGSRKSGK